MPDLFYQRSKNIGSAETLAGEWIELFQMTTSKPVNNVAFKTKHDIVASKYKKLSMEEQGEFTEIIHRKVREILPWTSKEQPKL
jgi:hypothetical protein